MTIQDVIRERRAHLDRHPKRRAAEPAACPVNGVCSNVCFARHACEQDPDGMRALLARLDPGIARAVAGLITDNR